MWPIIGFQFRYYDTAAARQPDFDRLVVTFNFLRVHKNERSIPNFQLPVWFRSWPKESFLGLRAVQVITKFHTCR